MRLTPSLIVVLTLGTATLACGDATNGGSTADGDTASASDADPRDTAGASDADLDAHPRDTTPPGDVTGTPLDGTPLAGLTVTWGKPLVLCNAWREGATVAAEEAHKVRITLPAQSRSDLVFASLVGATLVGAEVQTGPFAGEQLRPEASARVTAYEVIAGEGYTALGATVEHDLGAGGVLAEEYAVTRSPGQTAGVEITEGGFEVRFSWAPTAGDERHLLEPCALPADYEVAVAVLAATDPGGTPEAATLLRFYGTLHSEFSAGSYPVRLVASQFVLSDEPWRVFEVTDPWAQTYAAQHHNWGETSRFDFTRDLTAYQQVFKPLAAGETIWAGALRTVALNGVGGGGAGSVTFTRLAADGTPSTAVLATGPGWLRVDRHHLERLLAATCSDGTVGAVGFGDHVAQLMFCRDAAGPHGRALVGVVPVVWDVAPTAVGQIFEGAAITPLSGRLGWHVALGDSELVVESKGNDAFIIDVLDAGGTSVSNTYATLFELGPTTRWDAPVVAAAGDVTVSIARRWIGQGVGMSSIFAAESMALSWGDDAYTVAAWDRLDYVNTHHNWQDSLAATTDDGHVLHWKVTYEFGGEVEGLVHRVWVTGPTGETVLPETIVTVSGAGG